jgi:hypothetical protein
MEDSSVGTGELEGSTLGRNSRDEDNRNNRPRRTHNSGGFLLDSAFAPISRLSGSGHGTQRSREINSGKRGPTDGDLTVPKRRNTPSRAWHKEKGHASNSPLTAVTNTSAPEAVSDHPTGANSSNAGSSNPPAVGLDTDPAQIVNLALNLSESRRRTYAGRMPSSPLPGVRRNLSHHQSSYIVGDNHIQRTVGGVGQSSRYPSHHTPEGNFQSNAQSAHSSQLQETPRQATGGFIPGSNERDWQASYEFSNATLARAEKARTHFELFSEYLRLLSHLPPLRHSQFGLIPADRHDARRPYNPLQCIRNRKVRFREKTHLDVEAEGWEDVAKVHEWLDSIEQAHPERTGDAYQCLKLPSLQHSLASKVDEDEDQNALTTSPSSSTRPTNNTGAKPQRPRFEWTTSPAELLADAAWLEQDHNKAKIIDRDGNKQYPDPSKLKVVGEMVAQPKIAAYDNNPVAKMPEASGNGTTVPPVLPTFQHTKPDKTVNHGRRRRKLRNALHITQTTSRSRSRDSQRWSRSDSMTSDSSSDDEMSRGRTRRSHWEKKLKKNQLDIALNTGKIQKTLSRSPKQSSKSLEYSSRVASVETRDYADPVSAIISPTASAAEREDANMSLEDIDSTAPNSPAQRLIFPSITANFSPPSSRSPSPRKKLPRVIESLHERTKSKRNNRFDHGSGIEESSPETRLLRKKTTVETSPKNGDRVRVLEPSPFPEEPSQAQGESMIGGLPRSDSGRHPKSSGQQESKRRGLLMGSRIAEIVGSEVSKVGDIIWRKENGGHSRQSSDASSLVSDSHDSDEDAEEQKSGRRTPLRRMQTLSDDEEGVVFQKLDGRHLSKPLFSYFPSFGSFRPDEPGGRHAASDGERLSPHDGSRVSNVHFTRAHPTDMSISSVDNTPYSYRRGSYGFGATLASFREDKPNISHVRPGKSFDGERPPITGLANADASTMRRPSVAPRAWSISERSIPRLTDRNLVEKREILRLQALLLSSGIKAQEITRRGQETRALPSEFLVQSLVNPHAPLPHIPRLGEFDYAARNLVERLENTKASLTKSMYRFSKSSSDPLKAELETLEKLVNRSLTPRVRAAALDAETLSTQLNTTSTLAIKQLSDALDKGLRRRNRRLRWIRRVGFVLLEWLLVGVMWWVWLLVMMFKILRGIGKGAVTGIRWVLWI